jgi:hypothetical protein
VTALLAFCAVFAPIYYHSYQFDEFISTIPLRAQHSVVSGDAPSDQTVLEWVVSRAQTLGLPGYSVDLHFNPLAGR